MQGVDVADHSSGSAKKCADELASATDARLLENRFQVVLNGVLADGQSNHDLSSREATKNEPHDPTLRRREATRSQNQGRAR